MQPWHLMCAGQLMPPTRSFYTTPKQVAVWDSIIFFQYEAVPCPFDGLAGAPSSGFLQLWRWCVPLWSAQPHPWKLIDPFLKEFSLIIEDNELFSSPQLPTLKINSFSIPMPMVNFFKNEFFMIVLCCEWSLPQLKQISEAEVARSGVEWGDMRGVELSGVEFIRFESGLTLAEFQESWSQ